MEIFLEEFLKQSLEESPKDFFFNFFLKQLVGILEMSQEIFEKISREMFVFVFMYLTFNGFHRAYMNHQLFKSIINTLR